VRLWVPAKGTELMDYIALIVGLIGVGYGIWSDLKRRSDRDWIHMSLVNLKASVENPASVAAINNMLEFLKPKK
jgi:hypothetical protein